MGSFSILNNISAVNGQHQLDINNVYLKRTLQRLSSGMRINTGADDAAGLQIADSLRANVAALNQAIRNAGDGISFLQIADGALQEISNMLFRMVTLAEEAANEPVDAAGRRALDAEFQELQAEIARIARQTNFNGTQIFSENRAFGETLDLFAGDLSGSSYVNVNIGTIAAKAWEEPAYLTVIKPADEDVIKQLQTSLNKTNPVNSFGRINFAATSDNGDTSNLNDMGRSLSSIRIGSTIYTLNGVWPTSPSTALNRVADTTMIDDVWTTTWMTPDDAFTIMQKVSIVSNPADIDGESYKIEYEVINHTGVDIDIEFMHHLAVSLGGSDNAPFLADGMEVPNRTTYSGDIPGRIETFIDTGSTSPSDYPNGVIILNDKGGLPFEAGSEPTRVNFGNWGEVLSFSTTLPPYFATQKGYSIIWERLVEAGESVVMTTYYGVKNPPPEVILGLDSTAKEVDVIVEFKSVSGNSEAIEGYRGGGAGIEKVIAFGGDADAGLSNVHLITHDAAARALGSLRRCLNAASGMRGEIGAGMNRLQAAISVMQTQSRNTLAAESSIRDANMAEEITNLTKHQILAQTGIAALAHSNSNSQLLLALLR